MLKITHHKKNQPEVKLSKMNIPVFIERSHLVNTVYRMLYFEKKINAKSIVEDLKLEMFNSGYNGLCRIDDDMNESVMRSLEIDTEEDLQQYASDIVDKYFPHFKG